MTGDDGQSVDGTECVVCGSEVDHYVRPGDDAVCGPSCADQYLEDKCGGRERMVPEPDGGQLPCPECDSQFAEGSELAMHLGQMHDYSESQAQLAVSPDCPDCGGRMTVADPATTAGPTTFVCTVCYRSVNTESNQEVTDE